MSWKKELNKVKPKKEGDYVHVSKGKKEFTVLIKNGRYQVAKGLLENIYCKFKSLIITKRYEKVIIFLEKQLT